MIEHTRTRLTATDWQIPAYAQESLWIETGEGIVRTRGETGLCALPAPDNCVTVRWCGEKARRWRVWICDRIPSTGAGRYMLAATWMPYTLLR